MADDDENLSAEQTEKLICFQVTIKIQIAKHLKQKLSKFYFFKGNFTTRIIR